MTSGAEHDRLLIRLDVAGQAVMWRPQLVEADRDSPGWVDVPVGFDEMPIHGFSRETIRRFEGWLAGASLDPDRDIRITSIEHWDDIGLDLWALAIIEIRDRVPIAYHSCGGLGVLWEIPTPDWVERTRAGLRRRWRTGLGPRPW